MFLQLQKELVCRWAKTKTVILYSILFLSLAGASRRRCLSILKTLRDRHLDLPGNPVTSYHLKTLLLYECEKHPREMEWEENCIADRINGIFLQLISCLQCRRCPHYFLPNMDLFKGKSPGALENAAKQVWRLTRIMLTNVRCLEELQRVPKQVEQRWFKIFFMCFFFFSSSFSICSNFLNSLRRRVKITKAAQCGQLGVERKGQGRGGFAAN